MGKKRIVKKSGQDGMATKTRSAGRAIKKKIDHGVLYITSTYNNTRVMLTDGFGNAVLSSSSGALGFKGSKKGTPYAAGKASELLAEKAITAGLKEVDVVVKGVGAGREAAIRSFIAKGINIGSIKDKTPVPFNGPKPPKPRRV
jgi:small subunit ribosomal protein S11